jgi:hypothetical protein
MLQSLLTNLAPVDLIAASLDVGLGLAAVTWLVVLTVRSIHERGQEGPSK